MKRTVFFVIALVALSSMAILAGSSTSKISGSYVEVRGQDVYIGACFANSETGLVGREGTMAWKIDKGEYNGVSLNGLSVVAALLGKSTLGDRHSNPFPIKTVLMLDDRASDRQRDALRAFAREASGKMLGTIVREEVVPISFEQSECAEMDHDNHGSVAGCVTVKAGSLLTVQTRNLLHSDSLCANAEIFYEPMSKGMKGEMPVFAEQMIFRGQGLGSIWSIPSKRSGYVADFEVVVPKVTIDNN